MFGAIILLLENSNISLQLNIHPGSAVKGMDKEKCLQQIAESINKAHSSTSNVTVLLENMCKQVGYVNIGATFQPLVTIIEFG